VEEIKRQVSIAHRKLVMQQFVKIVTWSLFVALVIATAGLVIPKIWALPVTATAQGWQIWAASWVGGAVAVGLLMAVVWTWLTRSSHIQAAIEIDRRYGLKERVSSFLTLNDEERATEVGRALGLDAEARVAKIDVREQFGLGASWMNLLPLAPAIAVAAMIFIPNQIDNSKAVAKNATLALEKKKIAEINKELKKGLDELEKKAAEDGLETAKDLLMKLAEAVDKSKDDKAAGRKEALVKLNDLKKELEKRKKQLAAGDSLREQLNQLKPADAGPAEKLADAMKNGDLKKAMNELMDLKKQLDAGKLSKEDKDALAAQLEQMQKNIEAGVQAQKDEINKLQAELAQAKKDGDQEKANQLEQKLSEKIGEKEQMERMEQMAAALGQCKNCMKNGDMAGAQEKLDQLAKDLKQLQKELDELELLDEAIDQIGQCKNGMCKGGKFAMKKSGRMPGQRPGQGMGEGQGQGDRPEEATDTNFRESRVRADAQKGEAIRTGEANGPNKAGENIEVTKAAFSDDVDVRDPDASRVRNLQRDQKEHVKEYFENLGDIK